MVGSSWAGRVIAVAAAAVIGTGAVIVGSTGESQYVATATPTATATATATPTPTPPPVTCDSTVSNRTALAAALGDTGNAGKTVCVDTPITGSTITVTTDFATQARFVATPNNMTVDMVPILFTGAHKVTIEGFNYAGPSDSDSFTVNGGSESQSVWMLKNHIHDHLGNGLILKFDTGVSTTGDIRFMGNLVECLSAGGTLDHGYGVRIFAGNGVQVQSPKFSYNTIDGCGAAADGMELGDMNNAEVKGNVVYNARWNGVGSDPHADSIMVWDQSQNVTFQDNRLYDSSDALLSPDSTINVVNNLAVNLDSTGNGCIDAHWNGSSGFIWITGHTYERNTFVECGSSGILFNDGGTGGTNNVLDRNILDSIACPPNGNSGFATKNHNLFLSSNPCSLTGTNTFSYSPTWANTTDPDSPDYYIPTNLPGGYSDAGYTDQPAGHLECPC